jgi:hypothetical protein
LQNIAVTFFNRGIIQFVFHGNFFVFIKTTEERKMLVPDKWK